MNRTGFYQMQHTITGWPGGRDPRKTQPGDAPVRPLQAASAAVFPKRVLVLSPFGGRSRHPLEWGMHLAAQVDELRASGSNVETIFPDGNSRRAFGGNMMDLSTRPTAARAGYDQGRALAGQLTEFWR